ncbi:Phytoene desaturase, pro-zeta-carotene producing [Rhodopirellula islandica]|uniref:Phytoene desaturase, pro-zeta-carotene producing n=1 Tax=Rhodopirellula islandica TaxID=595434 RepID=A0A0J1ER37_RHOIS|nr:hydroxysqualene dehydroxylase HpnE [Rhodopirellula islandica]KLU07934.1 Phytoene desaturase, pro-zeta-carotene producing [Rhodopirellula islandica]
MTKHVVVIGGGIAGLSAAEALSRTQAFGRGELQVELLDSRHQTGGRAGSFVEPTTGQTVDYCQHVAMGCCTTLLDLLQRLELLSQFQRYEELTFYHPQHGFSRFRPSPWLPPPLHLASSLSSLKHLTGSNRRQIRSALWRLMRIQESDLIDVTALEWLQANGQSEDTRTKFWDVILVSALGDVPQRVSMAAARKVMIDGFAGARNASDVWVPKRPLSEIFGESFREPLSRRGVRFELGDAVRGMRWDEGSERWIIERSSGESRTADHVVVATPWHVSRRWFPDLWGKQAGLTPSEKEDWELPFASSPITGIHLWLDRSLTPLPHVVMVGTLAQWFFQEPIEQAEQSSRAEGVYHQVVISGRHAGSDWPKEKLVAEVVRELSQAFPESGTPQIRKSRVVTDPHAVFCVSPTTQGCRPESKTSRPGLHLAGDAVATGWPATMEGAAISGQMAAKSVVESLGQQVENEGIEVPVGLKRGWLARRLIR